MACYVDTSAFYAYLVAEDRYHQPVTEYLSEAVRAGQSLFSSSLVLGETMGLLQHRHGYPATVRFMDDIFAQVTWRWVDAALFEEIWRIMRSRGSRTFTVVDASAVACIAERPGSVCVAVDPDLTGFGFEVHPQST